MMPNKRSLLKLVVICATVISLAWITRSTLCELRIRSGTTEVAAFWLTNPNGKATRRRGLCLRLPAVDALIQEHPSAQKKRRAQARRFHVDVGAYFRPAASRSSAALSVASHGKCSRPKWP